MATPTTPEAMQALGDCVVSGKLEVYFQDLGLMHSLMRSEFNRRRRLVRLAGFAWPGSRLRPSRGYRRHVRRMKAAGKIVGRSAHTILLDDLHERWSPPPGEKIETPFTEVDWVRALSRTELVIADGFEPPTSRLGNGRSIR